MQRRENNPRESQRPAQECSENKRGLYCLRVLGGSLLLSLVVALAGCGHPTIVIGVKDDPDASVSEDAGADADADTDAGEDGGE